MKKHLLISGFLLKFAKKATGVDTRECGYEMMLKSKEMVQLTLIEYETKQTKTLQFTEQTCVLIEQDKRFDLTEMWIEYASKYLERDNEVEINL